MASNPERGTLVLWCVLAVLVSSALVYIGTGIFQPLWWATWLAPLPILLIAPRLPMAAAFGVAWLAWFLGSLNAWRYLWNIVAPTGPHVGGATLAAIAIVFLFLAIPAIAFGAATLLSRHFLRRGAMWRAALAFPAAWVAYEFLSEIASPHSTFGNLAYSQMELLPLVQIASVTGIWGISFCLFLLPATAAVLLNSTYGAKQKLALAAGVGLFFALVIGFGVWRLQSTPAQASTVTAGLAASDARQNVFPQEPGAETQRLLGAYADAGDALARQGAEVIVFPEKLGVTIPDTLTTDDGLMQSLADRARAHVVVGLIRGGANARFNEARVYTPTKTDVLTYDKQHLLPAFESKLQPGTQTLLMSKPSGLWGVAICKDMDFPELSRQYGRAGVGLMLVPAWDFDDDGWLHDRMAVLRGVESGFSIARAAKNGLLTLSDNRGRVLAEQTSSAAPFATLVAAVPVRHDDTLYARLGDWFAWANLGLLMGLAASMAARGNKRK